VFLDAFFADFNVAVELDGQLGHMTVDRWWADMRRDNRLQSEGTIVLRFPGFVVLGDGCAVARETAAALTSRGWPGPPRSCTPCTSCGVRPTPDLGHLPS
jgi:very-short-patch-repair endonuclease